jgi:hypothetical protein
MINRLCFFFIFTLLPLLVNAQQDADQIIIPKFDEPTFNLGNGPKVYIDQSHHNFHQKSGRFKPFADLLTADGYQVDSIINLKKLHKQDVLVISNPINQKNLGNWQQPIHDAFTQEEIIFLQNWVAEGGNLLLIADHMPFAGAANTLANAFGFNFCDGFANLDKEQKNSPDIFSKENKRLLSSELTDGLKTGNIDELTTFTGSSFTIPKGAKGVLKFLKGDVCLAPEIAWQFNETTTRTYLEDSYQGAILNYGKGKIAVFGEAAMFTAQTVTNNSGTFKFGFHSNQAPNNIQFIRNLMFWLSNK